MKRFKTSLMVMALATVLVFTGCQAGNKAQEASKVESGTEQKVEQEAEAKVEIQEMKGEDLDQIEEDKKKKEDYLVIDVRDPKEYDEGHVKFAINIPVDNIKDNIELLDGYKDKNVVTICNSGKKSKKAAEELVANGFKHVYNAEGVKQHQFKTITKVKNSIGKQTQDMVNSGDYTVIDARDAKAYAAGHLKGAINVEPANVKEKISEIPKDKKVVTYCFTGNKSFVVAQELSDNGYDATNSLDGTKEYDFELEK